MLQQRFVRKRTLLGYALFRISGGLRAGGGKATVGGRNRLRLQRSLLDVLYPEWITGGIV